MIDLLLFALFFTLTGTAEGWRGIVPLQTQRSQVEQILGPPIEPCGEHCSYKSGEDRVFVRYSAEPCTQNNPWKIAAGTVIELSVYTAKREKISALRLDRRKFKRTNDPELDGYYWYEDEEQGLTYSVSKSGHVTGSYWVGSSENDKKLRCSSLSHE